MGLLQAVLYALGAGLAIPTGALVARLVGSQGGEVRDDVLHAVVAFGGGVLLVAVALVLVPKGAERLPVWLAPLVVLLGALLLLWLERTIARRRKGRVGQLMAMILDYVPESVGLGAALAVGDETGLLLAVLIGLQNLPEGFNSFRDLVEEWHPKPLLLALAGLALLGPAAAMVGFLLLAEQPAVTGAVYLFASGGILYAVFQDIAPLSHKRGHWSPALGAVVGFAAGLVGHMLLV